MVKHPVTMALVRDFLCLLAAVTMAEVYSQTTLTNKTYCELCVQHTMCLHPDETVKCQGYLTEGVSGQDVNLILELHNKYRSLVAIGNATRGLDGTVQPPAANMRHMTWDPELATIAQRWANQCTWGHDICRAVERFPVGQSAFTASRSEDAPGADWAAAVDSWHDEIDLFDGRKATAFEFDGAIAHYTQLVWGDTYTIGCGYTYYNEPPWYTKLYICNYGPAGNWYEEGLYIVGAAGSQCPSDTVANATDGLCWVNTTTTSATAAPVAVKGLDVASTTVSVKINEMTCTCTTPVEMTPAATTPFEITPLEMTPVATTPLAETPAAMTMVSTTTADVDKRVTGTKKSKVKKQKS